VDAKRPNLPYRSASGDSDNSHSLQVVRLTTQRHRTEIMICSQCKVVWPCLAKQVEIRRRMEERISHDGHSQNTE